MADAHIDIAYADGSVKTVLLNSEDRCFIHITTCPAGNGTTFVLCSPEEPDVVLGWAAVTSENATAIARHIIAASAKPASMAIN